MALPRIRQRWGIPQGRQYAMMEAQYLEQHLINLQFLSSLSSNSTAINYNDHGLSLQTTTPASQWRQHLENLLWIASAIFIIYYGDFRSNLFTLLLTDPRILRVPFNMGLACVAMDMVVLFYISIHLLIVNKVEERAQMIMAPSALPLVTIIGSAAFVLLSVALWPIWNFLTLPMLFTLFMAVAVVTSYVPPYVNLISESAPIRCSSLRGL